jgi:hypothetical protein
MSFIDKIGDAIKDLDPTDRDSLVRQGFRAVDPTQLPDLLKELDPSGELEKIAMPLAQKWKDENLGTKPGSQGDFEDCVLIVATAVASTAAAIGASGGPVGAAIGAGLGAGGGYAAARIACRRVVESSSSGSSLSSEPELVVRDGLLIRGSSTRIYIIKGGKRRHIPNPSIFNAMGLDWNAVLGVQDIIFNTIPEAAMLLKGSSIDIYIIEAGSRRHIPNPATFNAMGLDWNAVFKVDDVSLNSIPLGSPIPKL